MGGDELRTYEGAGIQEGDNNIPWWLVLLWLGGLASGIAYIVMYA